MWLNDEWKGNDAVPSSSAIERAAARVVVLDPDGRVLLIRCVDDARGDSWWDTPGGGLKPDETHKDAALRELCEETGLREVELGQWVWTHHDAFNVNGVLYHQDERFFVVHTACHDVDDSGLEPAERRLIRGYRWWSVAELEATSEPLSPANLASLVRSLLSHGPPEAPVVLWSTARTAAARLTGS